MTKRGDFTLTRSKSFHLVDTPSSFNVGTQTIHHSFWNYQNNSQTPENS